MKKTARDLQSQIDLWARRNFTYIDQIGLGIGEEMGEYLQAHMKYRQRIRSKKDEGMSPNERDEKLKDALADAMIFTLHMAEANGTFISFEEAQNFATEYRESGEFAMIAKFYGAYTSLLMFVDGEYSDEPHEAKRPALQRIMNTLFALSIIKQFGCPIEDVLLPVWREVSKRDWQKYPQTGLPPVA